MEVPVAAFVGGCSDRPGQGDEEGGSARGALTCQRRSLFSTLNPTLTPTMLKRSVLLVATLLIAFPFAVAQVTTNKITAKQDPARLDSMRNSEYPYALPIL